MQMIFPRFPRSASGAVALEAILSIAFMFGALYCMWGASIVIYNQTKLNTATQLATHSALLTYDRETFRGTDFASAEATAQNVADSTFSANLRGLAEDQSGYNIDNIPPPTVNILCASNVDTLATASNANCATGIGANGISSTDQITEVTTRSSISGVTFWLLQPLSHPGIESNNSDHQEVQLTAHADDFSYGPYACYDQTSGTELC